MTVLLTGADGFIGSICLIFYRLTQFLFLLRSMIL